MVDQNSNTFINSNSKFKNNNKYKFAWQEKSSLLTIEVNQQAQSIGISELFHVNFEDYLAFYINNQAYFYFSEKDIIKWKNEGRKYVENGYLEKYMGYSEQLRKEFRRLVGKIDKAKLNLLSNTELNIIFNEYFNIVSKIAGIYHASQPEALFYVDYKIKNLISKEFPINEIDYVFNILSTPQDIDLIHREEMDWIKLMSIQKPSDNDFLNHARKYAAYFFNTYSNTDAVAYLKNRKNSSNIKLLEQEISDYKKHLKTSRKEYDLIIKKSSPLTVRLAEILQKVGVDRYELKEGWQGSEFLCLDLFVEISNRIGVNIPDFFASYGKKDIEIFLLNNIKLAKREINDRKMALYIKNSFGTKTFMIGLKAKKEINEFFATIDKKKDYIEGVGAMYGVAIGKAMVILVEDISSFNKSITKFNKGDILITTMTSPNIISLLDKASGVITNEGGVCSHAAIVSREFGIPCIVGTGNATRIFKSGDFVYIDAKKGFAKKITKQEYLMIKNQ